MVKKYDVIIIGAGPAGISAAVQLKRFGLSVLIFEKNEIGGLIRNAFLIENLIYYPDGINGKVFANKLKETLRKFEIEVVNFAVNKKNLIEDITNKLFIIENKNIRFISNYIIFACGTEPKKLDLLISQNSEMVKYQRKLLSKKYIKYEITEFQKLPARKTIFIVGGGDVGFDYALSLNRKNNKIFILNRSDNFKAIKILRERVKKYKNIYVLKNSYIDKVEISGEYNKYEKNNKKINKKIKNNLFSNKTVFKIDNFILNVKSTPFILKIHVINKKSNKRTIYNGDIIIGAIGRKPSIRMYELYNSLKQKEKIFAIGDFAHPDFRQVSIAMGDGLKVAMQIAKKTCLK